MATPISHAVAALSIGSCFYRTAVPKRVWIAAALCSAVPDLDAIGFRFGVQYGTSGAIVDSLIPSCSPHC